MTMFSMKPKFDLAAFLAEPAKPNTSRRRMAAKKHLPPVPDEPEAEPPTDPAAPAA
jgi:hypothetical protein